MPGESLAGNNRGVASGGIVDRQVQGVHARATKVVRVRIEIGIARGVSLAMPRITVALSHRLGIVRAMVNRQVQRHHTVAACGVRQREGRSIRTRRVCHAINPRKRLTCSLFVNASVGIMNRQMQRVNARAAKVVRV